MSVEQMECALKRVFGHHGGSSSQFENTLLVRLYVHIVKGLTEMSNEVLKPFGISQVGFSTLLMLQGSKDKSSNPSLVCDMTGESRANMTRISDELLALGLIERLPSEDDRRRLVLSITPEGESLLGKIVPLLRKRAEPVFSGFSSEEKKNLAALLKRQLHAIDEQR